MRPRLNRDQSGSELGDLPARSPLLSADLYCVYPSFTV